MKLLRVKKRIGIGVRLAIMVAVLLILSTGFFTAISLMSQRRATIDMFIHGSRDMCRSLERILRFSMLENRRNEIGLAIKQMATENNIKSVTLVTHRGVAVYSSGSGPGKSVSMDDPRCSACHASATAKPLRRLPTTADFRLLRKARMAEIYLPIYNAPNCFNAACHVHSPTEDVLGVMQMDMSYAGIDKTYGRSYVQLMALSVLLALVTSLIVLGLIRQWVTIPVKDLLGGTRRVADGELGHIIPVGEAELGGLARAFNKMQEKLLSSQRQLITAEKLASIGKLAASVAHEINNPLTGILTFAEDLVENAGLDDPHRPDYQVIQRQAIRCRQIVRELLDFSRQEKPDLQPVDMNEILQHTLEFVSKQAIFRNVKVTTRLEENLPTVTGDPVQIEQVILDLLVNASEAMPKGGEIFIASATLARTKEVQVSVRDTGPGIAEENLPRIFEPFFSTKGGKSMGIGLAVSWNIIHQHGGRLEVDSKPEEGATFRITMPWSKTARIPANVRS